MTLWGSFLVPVRIEFSCSKHLAEPPIQRRIVVEGQQGSYHKHLSDVVLLATIMSAEKAATAAAPAPALVSAPAESQPPRALDSEVPLETGSTASKSSQAPEASRDGVEAQYVTGYKLAAVVFCVALACFLMLVDTMVVSTVSLPQRRFFNFWPPLFAMAKDREGRGKEDILMLPLA